MSYAIPAAESGEEDPDEEVEEESGNDDSQEDHGPPFSKRMHCVALRLVGLWVGGVCLAQDETYVSATYKLETYWTKNSIGFRQRHGERRQLFSIGGTTTCSLSIEVLQGWAEETLKRLDNTKRWEDVRDWVKEQIEG